MITESQLKVGQSVRWNTGYRIVSTNPDIRKNEIMYTGVISDMWGKTAVLQTSTHEHICAIEDLEFHERRKMDRRSGD